LKDAKAKGDAEAKLAELEGKLEDAKVTASEKAVDYAKLNFNFASE